MVTPVFQNTETKRTKKGAVITVCFKRELDITEDMIPYVNYQIIFKNTPKYDYCGFHWFKQFPVGRWSEYYEEIADGEIERNQYGDSHPPSWWLWLSDGDIIDPIEYHYPQPGIRPSIVEFNYNYPTASYADSTSVEMFTGEEMNTFVKKGDKKYILYVAKIFYVYGIETELKPENSATNRKRVIFSISWAWVEDIYGIWRWRGTVNEVSRMSDTYYNQIWHPKNIETNFELLINTNKK